MTGIAKISAAAVLAGCIATAAVAQPQVRQGFTPGQPIGVAVDGDYTPVSENVNVFGGLVAPHSCAVDQGRGLVVVPSRGYGQNLVPNDAYVSLMNPDGTVNTLKWIGINRNGRLVLNDPTGTAISDGTLYIADVNGGTRAADGGVNRPSTAVIRMFDLATGTPTGSIEIAESTGFHGIVVAADGTIFAVETGPGGAYPPPESQRVYRIDPNGEWSVLVEGAPLSGPTGIAIDQDGNVVVINNRNDDVMTFSRDGELLNVEDAAATGDVSSIVPGNAGLVIASDGTKFVSSTRTGMVTRLVPGQAAETVAVGVQGALSMCLNVEAGELYVPLGTFNALAIIRLP